MERIITSPKRTLGVFFALALLVFGDKLFLGEYALIRVSDTFDTSLVEFKTLGDLLFNYGAFAWYPNLAGGRPSHAFQFTPLYPLVVAAHFLPLWLLYAGMKILLMLTAGYGMFRFCRDYLGFEPDLALLGGVVFAFNSQTQVTTIIHAVFNFAFPLAFVWSLGITRKGVYSWIPAALGLILLSLLTFPVLTGPAFASAQLLLILFLNPVHRKSLWHLLVKWALFWLGYSLIFLPLLYALLDFKGESQRTDLLSTVIYNRDLLFTAKGIGKEFLVASLLLFPIGGAIALASRSPLIRRALVVNLIPFLFVVIFTSRVGNVLRQTFLAKMEFQLLGYAQNFLLTVLALIGLRFVLARRELLKFYLLGGTAGWALSAYSYRASAYGTLFFLSVLIPIGIYLYLRRCAVSIWPEAYSPPAWLLTAALLLALTGIRVNIFRGGQEGVSYRRYFAGNTALAEDLARGGVGRVLTLGFHPSLAHNLGAESADAYTPLFSGRYRAVWRVAMAGQLTDEAARKRFDWYWYEANPLNAQTLRDFTHRLHSTKYCPSVFEQSLGWHTPLLLASNVTVVMSLRPVRELERLSERVIPGNCPERREGVVTYDRLRRFFTPAALWVYFLKDTFGRGYLVDRAEVLNSDREVLEALGRWTVADFRRSVLLSAEDGDVRREEPLPRGAEGTKRAVLKDYGPDRVVFDVDTPGPAYLVVSNNYNRKWTARVAGRPVPVLRANHAFQAVRIDSPGRHEVVLEYNDRLLWLSYAAVPLGIGLIIAASRPLKETGEGGTAALGPRAAT